MFYKNLRIDMPWDLSCCLLIFTIFDLGKKKFPYFPFYNVGRSGGCLRSILNPFQVVGPTTEEERVCIVAEWANGTTKLPWIEDHSVRRPAQEEREYDVGLFIGENMTWDIK